MRVQQHKRRVRGGALRTAAKFFWLLILAAVCGPLPASAQTPKASQEPQGEVIGTIEGPAIALKGPMSAQVVGNQVKTMLRSGVDVRVKMGGARIDLAGGGGTIAICGPAHISMLKAANGLTIAVDSGTIHAHIVGKLTLSVFTAQIVARPIAIGGEATDILVGFDTPGLMCVRAARGAVRLEEQFGSQSIVVPQGGDVLLVNGQLEGMRQNSALCACDAQTLQLDRASVTPEFSTPATGDEVKKSAAAKLVPSKPVVPAPVAAAPPTGPTYQVYMPPLRYDASQTVQDEPDPKLIVLVRRVRVRPTLIFESRVEGDPVPVAAKSLSAAAAKPQEQPAKPASPTAPSLFDRLKSFLKSLWGSRS